MHDEFAAVLRVPPRQQRRPHCTIHGGLYLHLQVSLRLLYGSEPFFQLVSLTVVSHQGSVIAAGRNDKGQLGAATGPRVNDVILYLIINHYIIHARGSTPPPPFFNDYPLRNMRRADHSIIHLKVLTKCAPYSIKYSK